MLLSPDGSRAYSEIQGATFWVDTSNDQIHYSFAIASNSGGVPDLAISGDGTTVDIDSYLTDPLLNAETIPVYVDWETWFPTATLGHKLSGDGSILFQPLTDGIDLIARNTGRLLYRVQIPVTVASVYDSLVLGSQNVVGVITTSGVSFVDVSTLPIPSTDSQSFSVVGGSRALLIDRDRSMNETPTRTVVDRTRYLRGVPKLRLIF